MTREPAMMTARSSQWSLTFEVRKSRTYGPWVPSSGAASQWSLTFEVRKRTSRSRPGSTG